jgi:single-strand DNA-binding protein
MKGAKPMASETTLTIIGNLVQDPELRFTASGAAVANFTVASTPRVFDRTTGEWKDGETLFLRCALWRQTAQHVAESLTKGTRVIVNGHLNQRTTPPSTATTARTGPPQPRNHRTDRTATG